MARRRTSSSTGGRPSWEIYTDNTNPKYYESRGYRSSDAVKLARANLLGRPYVKIKNPNFFSRSQSSKNATNPKIYHRQQALERAFERYYNWANLNSRAQNANTDRHKNVFSSLYKLFSEVYVKGDYNRDITQKEIDSTIRKVFRDDYERYDRAKYSRSNRYARLGGSNNLDGLGLRNATAPASGSKGGSIAKTAPRSASLEVSRRSGTVGLSGS